MDRETHRRLRRGRPRVVSRPAWLAACLLSTGVLAQESQTTLHSATLLDLFPFEEAAKLSSTLPVKRHVFFHVRAPAGRDASGVLVYVSPGNSGELPEQWRPVLDEKRLTWIAADDFGNSRPTAERVLAAVMALRLARKLHATDENRLYIAGMSGGGRVASVAIAQFPQLFNGAIFMVGANFDAPKEARLRELFTTRRLVFVTGSRDFNRRELRAVRDRYQEHGITRILWIDEPGFGHEPANGPQLVQAIDFLDGR